MDQQVTGVESNRKRLSTFEASAIITGYGIGGGVMAMPYLVNKIGVFAALGIMILAFLANYFMHMMIADLIIKSGKNSQVLDVFNKFVLKGKAKKVLTIILFIIIAIVLYANLAVYIAGAAEMVNAIFPDIPIIVCKLIFYAFALLAGMFGLKILGISEKYTILVIFAIVGALAIGSCFNIRNQLALSISGGTDLLAFFGVAMFSFVAFFSVPQVVNGLDGDVKKIKRSISLGMLMNFLIMVVVILFSLLSATDVTVKGPIITYWAEGIGTWAKIVGNVFVLLAMLTTYWSISFALKDIIKGAIKWHDILCVLLATLPSLLVALIPNQGFFDLLNLTAGAIAILIGLFVIPTYHIARKEFNGDTILGKFGRLPVEIITLIMFILMAVGSII